MPTPFIASALYPLAESPAGVTSASAPDHQTPMKFSIGKRMFAASWIATWFITPQPHIST